MDSATLASSPERIPLVFFLTSLAGFCILHEAEGPMTTGSTPHPLITEGRQPCTKPSVTP